MMAPPGELYVMDGASRADRVLAFALQCRDLPAVRPDGTPNTGTLILTVTAWVELSAVLAFELSHDLHSDTPVDSMLVYWQCVLACEFAPQLLVPALTTGADLRHVHALHTLPADTIRAIGAALVPLAQRYHARRVPERPQ